MANFAAYLLGVLCQRLLHVSLVLSILVAVDACGYQDISTTSGASESPALAVDNEGRIAVVWADFTPGTYEIFFSRSTYERSFSPPQSISHTAKRAKGPAAARTPAVAIDTRGNINVVWAEKASHNSEIFFTRSTNGGKSFAPPQNLSRNVGLSVNPKIAVNRQSHIAVVWADNFSGPYDILFTRSTDGGKSFSPPQNLSHNKWSSEFPALAVDGDNNLYVVWRDKTPPTVQIWFTRSSDGGKSFSPPKVISRTGFSDAPAIAAEGNGNLYVVWASNAPGNFEIFFTRSANGGASFTPVLNISQSRLLSGHPAIATDGRGNVYVAWADKTRGKHDIFFRHSSDRGDSFFRVRSLSGSSPAALSPAVAALRGGGVFVVWQNYRTGTNYGISLATQEEIRDAAYAPD